MPQSADATERRSGLASFGVGVVRSWRRWHSLSALSSKAGHRIRSNSLAWIAILRSAVASLRLPQDDRRKERLCFAFLRMTREKRGFASPSTTARPPSAANSALSSQLSALEPIRAATQSPLLAPPVRATAPGSSVVHRTSASNARHSRTVGRSGTSLTSPRMRTVRC